MNVVSSITLLAFSLFSAVRSDGTPPHPVTVLLLLTTCSRAMGAHRQEQLRKSQASVSILHANTAQLLLILDLQVGLYQVARDWDPTLYRDNIIAHAALGQLFDLPVVMTTSAQQGPNGPLPKEILEMYPDAPLIKRQGEVEYVPYPTRPSSSRWRTRE
jgi:hypothetical protein